MSAESVGSCSGPPAECADPRRPFRQEMNFSPNTPDRSRYGKSVVCYSCNQEGHYSPQCPLKTGNNLLPKHPDFPCRLCGRLCVVRTSRTEKNPGRDYYKCESSTCNEMFQWCDKVGEIRPHGSSPPSNVCPGSPKNHPELLCKTCSQPCMVRTSHSVANPGRDYYKCLGGACSMFQWCDQANRIRPDGGNIPSTPVMQHAAAMSRIPVCQCTAGPCRVETKQTGPHKGRKYFACCLKMGQGACEYKAWCDGLGDNVEMEEDLNHNLTGTNNSGAIEVEEEVGIILEDTVPTSTPPLTPPIPVTEHEVDHATPPLKRTSSPEGSPLKRKRVEECSSNRAPSTSLNWYLHDGRNNTKTTNKGILGRQNEASSLQRTRDRGSSWLKSPPIRRLNLDDDRAAELRKCVVCQEVGHEINECPLHWSLRC